MRRVHFLFIVIFLFASQTLLAQGKGFYMQPTAGAGITNCELLNFPVPVNKSSVFSWSGGLEFNASGKRWQFGFGLTYLKTGYKLKDFPLPDVNGRPIYLDVIDVFPHLLLPLRIGYQIPAAKHWTIVPELGLAPSLNMRRSVTIKSARYGDQKTRDTEEHFKDIFRKNSLFMLARVGVYTKVAKNLSLGFSPTMYRMLTSMFNPEFFKPDNPKQHNYALQLEVKLAVNLTGEKHNKAGKK